MFGKFTSEPMLAWNFLFWKVIICWFNFFCSLGLYILTVSFCVTFRRLCLKGIDPFHLGYQIVGIELLIIGLYFPFNAHGVYSDIPSFISDIRNLCLPSFFFLVNLVTNLPILLKQPLSYFFYYRSILHTVL